uniref:ORF-30 n=1 Tax=Buzura suppressaria nuclear polyhedrosis virus TaxID=74320 RepID=A0A0N7CTK4_NPVBS|nr:ORF-30 [Buzura suppressaria nucleopolyhedrovirus]QYF10543.1 hypothetical protein [Buzura suppressaria nucleopolyhedrovirus]
MCLFDLLVYRYYYCEHMIKSITRWYKNAVGVYFYYLFRSHLFDNMFVLKYNGKCRITVRSVNDEDYFDFVEIRKFSSNHFKSDEFKKHIGRVSKTYVKKRYIKLCETLLYLYCFENTDNIIEFIYNNVHLNHCKNKCY